MPDNIPALAAAFLAIWQSDASPMMRAALVELLRAVQAAERERCDRPGRAGLWRDGRLDASGYGACSRACATDP